MSAPWASARSCLDVTPVDIIAAKRDARELSPESVRAIVSGFASGRIPDYQMAAFAMAVCLNGMTPQEVDALTAAMLDSGQRLSWPTDGRHRVDKHSTGGVGDKTSLILAPLLAACDLQIPMLSGRGLGPTGGTLDKLESIPGFRTNLSLTEIIRSTREIGCVITGTTEELAPADRRLYALRDVTATVPSVPLITASIMSKKLAESVDALVLDVKFGSGAFMKSPEAARTLAESLTRTGRAHGVHTTALLTDMNQPLGRMCGNAVEVQEAVDVLQGRGPRDLRTLTLALAAELLISSGAATDHSSAESRLQQTLDSGGAWERWCRMIRGQGGDPDAPLSVAPASEVTTQEAGYVAAIDTESLGLTIIAMGGGRAQLGDAIDHSVGIEMQVRVGDRVETGQPLFRVFHDTPERFAPDLRQAVTLSPTPVTPLPLIAERITG